MVKVAFVHDWLVTCRGGEKVLEALLPLYPDAPVFTLFYDPAAMPESIRGRKIFFPAGLNRLRPLRKALLPFLPAAIESLPLFDFDLLISTSSCVAKGALPGPVASHLCYIHSPMRYVWDQRDEYVDRLPRIPGLRTVINRLSADLRQWDVVSAKRVDQFVANSRFVQQRVRRFYGRDASVVYPPVDVQRFLRLAEGRDAGRAGRPGHDDYYLVAGAAVSYKRFDLAVDACRKLGRKLVIAGDGPEWQSLRKKAGAGVEFVRGPDDATWESLMAGARALLFPGVEDFGITGVEALAAGTPVIAQRAGGALDFMEEGSSGVYFDRPEVDSLAGAIKDFEEKFVIDPRALESQARKFSTAAFQNAMKQEIDQLIRSRP